MFRRAMVYTVWTLLTAFKIRHDFRLPTAIFGDLAISRSGDPRILVMGVLSYTNAREKFWPRPLWVTMPPI